MVIPLFGSGGRLSDAHHEINDSDPFDPDPGEGYPMLTMKSMTLTPLIQLAGELGIAQQTLAHYEGGTLRIAVALLPTLSVILGLSLEELVGVPAKPGKRGPAPKLQQQLERVSQLPKARQRIVSEVLDSLLAQGGR